VLALETSLGSQDQLSLHQDSDRHSPSVVDYQIVYQHSASWFLARQSVTNISYLKIKTVIQAQEFYALYYRVDKTVTMSKLLLLHPGRVAKYYDEYDCMPAHIT